MIMLMMSLMFSPMVQPIYQHYINYQAPAYSTPIKELEKSHKVVRGFMCWHPFEVVCIDGVCGDGKTSYWVVKVNGDSLHYNANSRISPTDSVSWEFVSSEGI